MNMQIVRDWVAPHHKLAALVSDTSKMLTQPRNSVELYNDWKKTSRSVEFLRHACFEDSSKVVLVASLSSFVYQVKTEAMFVLGLKQKGWKPMVLLSPFQTWSRRYFRAFGIDAFVYWDQSWITSGQKEQAERDAEEFLSRPLNFPEVKKWMYRDVWVGPQILSSVARSGFLGTPDPSDPLVAGVLKNSLSNSFAATYGVERLLSSVNPEMILLNEPNGMPMGVLTDLAVKKGINCIFFAQPSRDDAFIFKRITKETRRTHPNSLNFGTFKKVCARPWSAVEDEELDVEFKNRYGGKWFLQTRNQPDVVEKSKSELITELGLDSNKKIAVIFSHILWDANLFYGEDLFNDYGDWFVQSIESACANDKVNWIIKLHPANIWKRTRENVTGELAEVALLKTMIGDLPKHVTLLYPSSKVSTLSLFRCMDYGITVRGTVGMELPCFGVRTFTAGTGRYSGLGFTDDSATKEEYLGKLATIESFGPLEPEKVGLARRHAHGVFKLRPWQMKSFRAKFNYGKRGAHPLDHNLLISASTVGEIENNGDLRQWAEWAADVDRGVDFLVGSEC